MKVSDDFTKNKLNLPNGDQSIHLNIKQIKNSDSKKLTDSKLKETIVLSNRNSFIYNGNTGNTTYHEREFKSSKSDLELSWMDIDVALNIVSKKISSKKEKKIIKSPQNENQVQILKNISGSVRSGQCLAIIGSSGAGKTTLLNLLSCKIPKNDLITSGEYKLNGQKIQPECFSLISAYIMQDDVLEPTLTPLEILMFTAKLKLNLQNEEIDLKVQQMLSDLNLRSCQNTRVGNILIRGVSGGERKRTSIGVELISDPKIIFLDEPTTGLDSYNAYEVILLLRKLSSQGKIIIFTIHQPSSEIYSLLDKLCILALGRTVYFGPSQMALDFFHEISLPLPNNYNPFEHFIEITNITAVEQEFVLNVYTELNNHTNIQERYTTFIEILSNKYIDFKNNKLKNVSESDSNLPLTEFSQDNWDFFKSKKKRPGIFYELAMLIGRSIVINIRNGNVLRLKIYQSLVSSVLISILFIRVSSNLIISYQKISVEYRTEMDSFFSQL